MKFLHLSDLHIGKRVNEVSMLDDQAYILDQILRMTVRRTLLRTQARTPPHKKAWLRKKNVLFKSSWKACCQM